MSSEGESQVQDKHPALQSNTEAHDNSADALLRYVDELLSGEIRYLQEMELQRNIVWRHKLDAKLHCKVPLGAYCEVHVNPDITT